MSGIIHRRRLSPSNTESRKIEAADEVGPGHPFWSEMSFLFKLKRLRLSAWLLAALATYVVLALYANRHQRPSVKWNAFQQDYMRRYRRAPPNSLKQWLKFASSKGCDTMRFYDGIERDLVIFRNRKLTYDEVVKEAMHYTDYFAAYEVKNNGLTLTNWQSIFDTSLRRRLEAFNLQRALKWLLKPLVHHKPPIHSKFVFNLRDEPTNIEDASVPIFSSCHASDFNDNLVYNNRTPAVSKMEEPIMRDLLVPYYFSVGLQFRGLWFWPFYSRGPSWKDRKDSIVWRGSTTGVPWGDAPRFWLLEQYGGSEVHEIVPGVSADFAFVRVVQNDNGQGLSETYRQQKALSYRDIQRHKYVIDVDGNCKYLNEYDGLDSSMNISLTAISLFSFYRALSQIVKIGIARL